MKFITKEILSFQVSILHHLGTDQIFRLLSDTDVHILMKTLGLLRNLLSNKGHIDQIMQCHGKEIMQVNQCFLLSLLVWILITEELGTLLLNSIVLKWFDWITGKYGSSLPQGVGHPCLSASQWGWEPSSGDVTPQKVHVALDISDMPATTSDRRYRFV